ncbi:MAG: 30S ribosomal protein S9 [Candidatus Micrarchaeota archaeon]
MTTEKKAEKPKEEKPKRGRKAKKPKKKAEKVFVAKGKRKSSIARATITKGNGVVRINGLNLNALNNKYVREIIREPLTYLGPEVNDVNISINVHGGGVLGQAQASRTAISNALIAYFETANLKEKFGDIDRSLIVSDSRRVESKKYRGPKSRARYQKSYR